MAQASMIRAENITKQYLRGIESVMALDGVSLEIKQGEFTVFLGPSGSGKTTLINILGCLDNPTSGTLAISGETVFSASRILSEKDLTTIRRRHFGYIFQNFLLIPTLTVYENVILPFTFHKKKSGPDDAVRILEMLGMKERMKHLPSQLSGGEMQRVAIARALANDPDILLADEPTGNLDSARSLEIGSLLRDLNRKQGLTIILVTHNPELAAVADRKIELRDGKIHTA